MKILIIRHGDPDYALDSLTEKGWREAELLARRMETVPVRDFYVSPLGRAQATARVTLNRLGREAETLPWLREFDGWIQSPFETRRRIPWNLMPQYWTEQPELFQPGEWLSHGLMRTGTVKQVYEETCRGLDELLLRYGYSRNGYVYRCERNTDDTIALFCHFGIAMAMLSHMMGASLPWLWQCFLLPTSSVTTLVTEERLPGEVFFRCFQMGDTSHLFAGGEPVSRAGMFPELYEN